MPVTIDREPQKRYIREEFIITPEYEELNDYINRLTTLRDSFPPEVVSAMVDTQGEDGYGLVTVTLSRMETPEEVEERVARQEEYNRKVLEFKRKEYEILKAQFGDT